MSLRRRRQLGDPLCQGSHDEGDAGEALPGGAIGTRVIGSAGMRKSYVGFSVIIAYFFDHSEIDGQPSSTYSFDN